MSTGHRHRTHSHVQGLPPEPGRREALALLVFALGLIALLTLMPMEPTGMPPYCGICPGAQTADFIVNVFLFVPFGVALGCLGVRWKTAMAIGAGVSIAIEVAQYFIVAGRVASPLDVIANSLGTAAGIPLAAIRGRLLYPRSRRGLTFSAVGAGAWLILLALSAAGFRRSIPDGVLFGEWSPELELSARFEGRVGSANVGRLPLPDGEVSDGGALRAEMEDGLRVAAAATAGQRTPMEAPIVRLVGADGEEVFVMARAGSDFVFRTRVAASALGLHPPTVVVRNAFAGRERDDSVSIPLTGERHQDALRASAGGTGATLAIHPALGWAFFAPFDAGVGSRSIVVSALWVGAPLFVIGYWIGRRARRRARRSGTNRGWSSTRGELLAATPALAFVVGVGLAGIALVFRQRIPPVEVWAAAVIGIGVGMAVGVRLAMRHAEREPRASSARVGAEAREQVVTSGRG